MDYQSTAAFPPIEVNGPNQAYARAMLSNLGGQNSEMTTIGSYFYDHLATISLDKTLSDIFMRIAMVEMHHLDIFGQLARKLGADPRLWECRQDQLVFWSPEYVHYPADVCSILRSLLSGEEEAICKYRRQAATIDDTHVTALLERIILDEQVHVSILKDLLHTYRPTKC